MNKIKDSTKQQTKKSLSPMARWLQELRDMPEPEIDHDKIMKAKEKLESGAYNDEKVISSVVDKIMDDWGV